MSKSCIISFLFLLLFAIPATILGQNRIVKGKVIKIEEGERKTFNSIPVTLYDPNQESRSSPSITNKNGTYYLYDVSEGKYQLEVWIQGELDVEDRTNSAKIYDITINYEEAVINENSKILGLDTIEINS